MSKLRNKERTAQNTVSNDQKESVILPKETLNSLEELGDILRKIHRRMVSEGYEIVNGNVQKM